MEQPTEGYETAPQTLNVFQRLRQTEKYVFQHRKSILNSPPAAIKSFHRFKKNSIPPTQKGLAFPHRTREIRKVLEKGGLCPRWVSRDISTSIEIGRASCRERV